MNDDDLIARVAAGDDTALPAAGDPAPAGLTFSPDEWRAFAGEIRAGRHGLR